MKRSIFLVGIVLPIVATAQTSSVECTKEAAVFDFAATYRDSGLSPQQTFERMHIPPSKTMGFPDDAVKDIINTVYFDVDAQKIPHGQMLSQVTRDCMFPPKSYRPLN